MKIFILLYADDTVLFSSNPNDLQKCLDTFKHYCTTWRLTVNVAKTKILIISQGRPSANLHFYYDSYELEIVKEYKYLGIYIYPAADLLILLNNTFRNKRIKLFFQ